MLTLLFAGILTLAFNMRTSESPVVHGLVILDVWASPSGGYARCGFDIVVTVRNNGTEHETFNVTVYYNDTAIETQTVTDLPSDANLTLTFTWYPLSVPSGTYLISANISSLVLGEIRKDDGYVEIWVWGDVNGDGKITLADVGKMDLIYSGIIDCDFIWPGICPRADLDCNGYINLVDVGKMILIYSGILP
jgi:hypothetical protein